MMVKTKLNWEKFNPLFLSWSRHFLPFFNSGGFDTIFSYLKSNKENIFPLSKDLWLPFQLCNYKDLKLVIAVEGPYLDNMGDGLALSAYSHPEKDKWIPEALDNFYDMIEHEVYDGLCISCVRMPSLQYLAKQGILLLNIPMTGDKKNGPHKEIWKPFIKHLIQECIAYTGVPVMLLGKDTWELEEYLTPWQERFKLQYPKLGWSSEGAFKRVKEIMRETNGDAILFMEDLPF